jgi:tripartite-type tricarboxylate transporter receptor subunit TctC
MSLASNYVLLPQTQATLPFNVARDFVPIGFVGSQWIVIAVPPSLGVNTLPELIALAKRKPGELNAEAALRGSILHLTAEWLKRAAGIDLTLLFYPSTPQALTDLIAGRVHVAIESLAGLSGSIKGGTLKALAVTSPQRLSDYPDLPTVAETLPGLVASGWLALMAPPKTPDAIAQKVSADLRTVLARPDVIERMQNLGTYPQPMTPAELASFIADQRRTWQPIIDAVGMAPPK